MMTTTEMMDCRFWVEEIDGDDMSEILFASDNREDCERFIAEDEFPELLTIIDTEED